MSDTQDEDLVVVIGNQHSHPSAEAFLGKLIRILCRCEFRLLVISGDNPGAGSDQVVWIRTQPSCNRRCSLLPSIANNILFQSTMIAHALLGLRRRRYRTVVCLSAPPMTMVFFRLTGARILRYQGGSIARQLEATNTGAIRRFLTIALFDKTANLISSKIIVESASAIAFQNLNNYVEKVVVCPIYVDSDVFTPRTPWSARKSIGFVGNFDSNKGIDRFLKAMEILEPVLRKEGLRITVAGDGMELSSVKEFLANSKILDLVELMGWVPHNEIGEVLNSMRILVIPSVSEGLPNVLLEAMACGTPVLATRVGAIPEVIEHGDTGFMMNQSTTEEIAKGVAEMLSSEAIENVARRGRLRIENTYSFNAAMSRWCETMRD